MRTVLVRYQVRPEAAAENEDLIRKVFAQLGRDKPAGLRYQVFKLDDGVSFVHVASSGADGSQANPLPRLEAFRNFVAALKDRCVEQPVTTQMHPVGAYDNLV
jgi:quinol monooxygenase YgiN